MADNKAFAQLAIGHLATWPLIKATTPTTIIYLTNILGSFAFLL